MYLPIVSVSSIDPRRTTGPLEVALRLKEMAQVHFCVKLYHGRGQSW